MIITDDARVGARFLELTVWNERLATFPDFDE